MLNPLEKKVLHYLLARKDEGEFISIKFLDENLADICMVVQSLEQKGYVKSACTLNSASAKLTPDGRYYFEQEERQKYGCYYDSIKLLEQKISEAQNLKSNTDKSVLSEFIYTTYMMFNDNFSDSTIDAFNTSFGLSQFDDLKSYYRDLDFLINLLSKLKAEQIKLAGEVHMQSIEIHNSPTFNNENKFTAQINLSTTIENVCKCDSLSPEEQAELNKILIELDSCKKKKDKNIWEKAKDAIKWVLEKSIEVGIAALPFIAQVIQCK